MSRWKIEGLTGSDPNVESKVVNPAFSNTPGIDPIIVRATRHSLEWDNSGKNVFYSRFVYGP